MEKRSTYYDFPLVFEREKLNNKDGKLLDWIGPNDVSIRERAIYQDNILRVYTDRKNITQVDTRVEVSGEETTDASGNTVDSHKIFVEPGQQEAEVPLKVYDAVDATAVSFAFQTDGEGAATQKLLNSEVHIRMVSMHLQMHCSIWASRWITMQNSFGVFLVMV